MSSVSTAHENENEAGWVVSMKDTKRIQNTH
uniref:Uncharacterized protein n=1 Tax=Anguilla anguilla TaxID=7936 RepID=A0A0E9XB12_ANGAN